MYKKLSCCKHCKIDFSNLSASHRANHSRWCVKNPKSIEHRIQLSDRTKTLHTGKVRSDETKERLKQAHKDGKYSHINYSLLSSGRTHSEHTKEILRRKALESPHRRLKKSTVLYKGVLLDSTWELALAQRLDEQNIKWVRPDPIKWLDNDNVTHNYFPDFYLPDYNLYLDPKNPQAVKTQQEKIKILLTQYPNIKLILSLKECKEFRLG